MIARSTVSTIFFLTDGEQAAMRHSGLERSFGQIIAVSPGSTHHVRTEASSQWATLSLTREDCAAAGHRVLAGRELPVPSVTLTLPAIAPVDVAIAELSRRRRKTCRRLGPDPCNPEPARVLEQALAHAMIMCVTDGSPVEMSCGTRNHMIILTRIEDFVAANDNRPMYLVEICAAIGASDRVLRICCRELGMAPMRYLWLRRMPIARRALGLATPATATVAQMAMTTASGSSGASRARYRALFGESPSA